MPSSIDPEELIQRLATEAASADGGRIDSTIEEVKAEIETIEEQVRKAPPSDCYAAEPEFALAMKKLASIESIAGDSSQADGRSSTEPLPPLGNIGQYRLLAQLGTGGMGTVYKAIHTRLEKIVAVKVLQADRVGPDGLARFHREMRAVGKLHHPNIVQAFDAGEENGTPFLVMECLDGCDLSKLIRQHGPLSPPDSCEIIRQAALALAHAHEHGLVHRDIKPSNVMLTHAGQVKLLDLGLARLREETREGEELTAASQVMGTADYMAPEQAGDSHAVDIRADIYSLGCTLYRLLTGEVPYPAPEFKTNVQKVAGHIARPFPDISAKQAKMPEGLVDVLRRMVAKQPGDRFALPADVAAALAPFTVGSDLCRLLAAPPVPRPGSDAPTTSTRPHLLATDDTTSGLARPRDHLPSAGATRAAGNKHVRPRWLTAVAASALLLAAAATIIKIQTSEGTLVLDVDGEGAVVTIDGEAAKVALGDDKHTYRISVQPGTHTLVVTTPEGMQYKTENQFTLEAGGVKRITAVLEREAVGSSQPPMLAASPTLADSPVDSVAIPTSPDRAAAEWVLGVGGTIGISVDGRGGGNPRSVGELPKRDFRVIAITLTSRPFRDDDLARLRNLNQLLTIYLIGTPTSDAGLKHLENLPALSGLHLTQTAITDAAFDSLTTLKALRVLNIGRTKLTSAGWSRLKDVAKLAELTVSDTSFGDDDLANLVRDQSGLKTLWLTNTKVSNEGLVHVAKLENLDKLNLSGTKITDAGLAPLSNLERLNDLNLSGLPIGDQGANDLSHLRQLQNLSLTDSKVSDQGLSDLSKIKTLRALSLNGTKVTDEGLSHLVALPNLSTLQINYLPITDKGAEQLGQMRSLVRLELGSNQLTDKGLESLSSLPKLKMLGLNGIGLTDAGLAHLTQLPEIAELLCTVTSFTDDGVEAFARATNLTQLVVTRSQVTPLGIAQIRRAVPKTAVRWSPAQPNATAARQVISWGGKVTIDVLGRESVIDSPDNLPANGDYNVVAIDLTDTTQPIEEGALEVLYYLRMLRSLDLRGTQITDAALQYMKTTGDYVQGRPSSPPVEPALRNIDLRDTKVTAAGVKSLQAALPKCTIEYSNQ
jgi:serine/threonine protein kinase/Leucine-rich repeat (LRR) protein